jgi:hypothetical protein
MEGAVQFEITVCLHQRSLTVPTGIFIPDMTLHIDLLGNISQSLTDNFIYLCNPVTAAADLSPPG